MTPRRILAFDGGGIRGVWSLALARALEERLGTSLHAAVDVVAGTSIGATLACAVAADLPLRHVQGLVATHAAQIFPKPWPWGGLMRPKYDPTPLRDVLADLFGGSMFGALPIRTLVPVYDVAAQDALVLDSLHPGHGRLSIVDVCLASAAAPTYFPAVPLTIGTRRVVCIDGGVAANNPALVAWALDQARHRGEPAIVVSIGTGKKCRPVAESAACRAGAFAWVRSHDLIGTFLAGPSDVGDDVCLQAVTRGNYFRLQTPLSIASDDLDDASPGNLGRLLDEATDYCAARGGDLTLDLAAVALLGARHAA